MDEPTRIYRVSDRADMEQILWGMQYDAESDDPTSIIFDCSDIDTFDCSFIETLQSIDDALYRKQQTLTIITANEDFTIVLTDEGLEVIHNEAEVTFNKLLSQIPMELDMHIIN